MLCCFKIHQLIYWGLDQQKNTITTWNSWKKCSKLFSPKYQITFLAAFEKIPLDFSPMLCKFWFNVDTDWVYVVE